MPILPVLIHCRPADGIAIFVIHTRQAIVVSLCCSSLIDYIIRMWYSLVFVIVGYVGRPL